MHYLSHYNSYIKKEDSILVYNTKFGNVVKFDADDIENVKSFLINEPTCELEELGFVCSDEFEAEEEKSRYIQVRYNKSCLNIMLIMTYECNCACKYCFENLQSNFVDAKKKDLEGTVRYIIDLYKQEEYRMLEIHFFGGEPVINVDGMVYVMEELIAAGVKVKPNVITNGVLLNEDIVYRLNRVGINSYQITLDGPKYIHDVRRPSKNGCSSWDAIMKNILFLAHTDNSVAIRINIDNDNVQYLEEICNCFPDDFKSNPAMVIYIAPIVGCMTQNTALETLEERARTLKKAWGIIAERNLPIEIQPPVYYPCPNDSAESAFYLDLYGNIYNCGGFVGKSEKIERSIKTKSAMFYKRNFSLPQDKCFKCEFGPVCFGGCKFEESAIGLGCQYGYLKEIYDEYYQKYAN